MVAHRSTVPLLKPLALLALVALLVAPGGLPAAAAGRQQLLRYQVAKLKAADAAPEDALGISIDIAGDVVVVGASQADDGGANSGAAYVFTYDPAGPGWVQAAKLTASDPAPYGSFGYAVAASGDTVAVGAYVTPPGGAVYLFYRDQGGPGAWGQAARITGLDTTWGDHFGFALDLDGDTLVVGAYAGGDYDGRAYVFYRDQGGPGAWGQAAYIVGSDVAAYDLFGCTVAVSGDTAVVGAPGHDDNYSGAAYIFQRDHGGPDAWGQVTEISLADALPDDWFGYPVAIHGDTAAIGVQGRPPDGAAYLFYRDQGGPDMWGQAAQVTTTEPITGTAFGGSVAILSDTLAVGAPGRGPGGAVYLFARHQGAPDAWGQVARLAAADAAPGAGLGSAAALDGDLLAAGAYGDEPGGSAYLFLLANTPPDSVEISGTVLPMYEGQPMSLTGRFADPDVEDHFTVTVAWGDGESGPADVGGSAPAYFFTATHTYAEGPANLPVTVTVVDAQGASVTGTATITVNNVPPDLADLPDREGTAGAPLTITVAFADPGLLDGHEAVVQWTPAASWTISLPVGVMAFTATYTYAEPARYTVTVSVADDDGGTDEGTFAVTVRPAVHSCYLPLVWR